MHDGRFWVKVNIVLDKTSCWLWQRQHAKSKYAVYADTAHGTATPCQRYIQKGLKNEEFAPNAVAYPKCGNWSCCRPGHGGKRERGMPLSIFSKTNPPPKKWLTDDMVRLIRKEGLLSTPRSIAKRWGLESSWVRQILKHNAYKDVS